MKLKHKFLIPTLLIIAIGMSLSAFVSYHYSKDAIESLAEDQIRLLASTTSKQIDSWFKGVRLNLTDWSQEMAIRTAVQDSFLGESARDTASERLSKIKANYKIYENLVLFNVKGETIASDNIEIIGKIKVDDRSYFQRAIKGEFVLSEVIQSRISGKTIITISTPIIQSEGKVEGVLIVSVNMSTLNEVFIRPIKVGETGHAYLADQKGMVIAHSNEEMMMKMNLNDSEFGKKIIKEREGLMTYTRDGREEMAAFTRIGETDWPLVVVANPSELLASVKKIGLINLGLTLSIVIIAGFVILLIASGITKPLGAEPAILSEVAKSIARGELRFGFQTDGKEMGGVYENMRQMAENLEVKAKLAERIAEGDLSNDVPLDSDRDILGNALQKMTDNLRQMLLQVRENSVILAGSSEDLFSVSSRLSGGVEVMSASTQNVSSTAEQMSAIMNSIASAIEEMSNSISEIAINAKQASDISENATDMSDEASKTISTLDHAAGEIGEVTELIRQIARQTNLLALNATIEAASAGDAGKGFAVVASEIKELASQSARAAEDIAKRISGVQSGVREVIRVIGKVSDIIVRMNESSVFITQGIEQQTATANDIASGVQEANQGVGSIVGSISEIAEGDSEDGKSVGSMLEISERADQVKSSADKLSKVTTQLQEIVTRFKLE